MTGTATKRQLEQTTVSTDERLIQRCLKGDQEARCELIDKYKNLIYSIPIKLGMYQDAGDIFQAVCVELLSQLPQLREHRALPKWLMQTSYRKCLRYLATANRQADVDPAAIEQPQDDETLEHLLVQLEKEQMLRDAIAQMPERCSQMIHMLFFEIPARPYEEIAKELGLATGSIGFIRGRCLTRLRKHLEKKGF
jgi:RNA polymerase sigma factor (sigma-70 family)